MENLKKAVREDVKAAFGAFKSDSFDKMNVFANRIMSNTIFGDDPKLFLPGFFLKDVASTFGLLKMKKNATAFSTAKAHGFTYIEQLEKSLTTLDEEQLWTGFCTLNEKLRKFEMDPYEEKSYSDNPEFTKECFKWLIIFLESNKDALFDPNNFLLNGIINEMSRILKTHSGTLPEVVIMNLLVALDRNYGYVCPIRERPDLRNIDDKTVKERILPFVDQIVKLYSQGVKVAEADVILWNLVKHWRELFIKYMELPVPSYSLQRGIRIPEELKKKLTEGLTKTLEKEM